MWQGVVAERNGTFIMDTKNFIKSKTIWVQIIAVVSALFPVVNEWLVNNPVSTMAAFGAINILVRFATSGKVTVLSDDTTPPSSLTPLFVACLALTALGLGSLVSCGLPVKAAVTYRHESGAKAGIEVLNGEEPRFWFKLPAFQNLAPDVISKLEEEHPIEPAK